MKKFLSYFLIIGLVSFIMISCNEEGAVTTDTVEYTSVGTTYTGGNDGGDVTIDPDGNLTQPEVELDPRYFKFCSWTAANSNLDSSSSTICIRTESEIADPYAQTLCWGDNYFGTANHTFRMSKNDPRYGSTTPVNMTNISNVFSSIPTQMDGGKSTIAFTMSSSAGDVIGSDATTNDEIGGMASHLSTRNGSPLQTLNFDNVSVYKAVSGIGHTMFLLSDGTLTGAGLNSHFQMGLDQSSQPKNIVTKFAPNSDAGEIWTDIVNVAAAPYATYIIRSDSRNKPGKLYGIGKNSRGQIQPDGPDTIQEWYYMGFDDVVLMAGSSNEFAFIRKDGSLYAMGGGDNGGVPLGDSYRLDANGNMGLNHPATKVTHYQDDNGNLHEMPPVKYVTAGTAVFYVITHDDKLMAYGSNGKGHAGVNKPSTAYITRPMYTGLSDVTDIAVYNTTAVARVGTGSSSKFYLVGNNDKGQVYADTSKATVEPVHTWQMLDLSNAPTPGETRPDDTSTAPVDPDPDTVGMPTNINATEITSTSMRFNWTAPTPTTTTTDGETVEKYNFQICSDPAGNCVLDNTTGYGTGNYRYTVTSLPQVTMAVNGIDPNTDVHVRVQSISKSGVVSDWTAEFIQKTLP